MIKCTASYLIGIVACIALTPVEMIFVGAPLILFYLVASPIGYILFFLLEPHYVFGDNIETSLAFWIGIFGLLIGIGLAFLPFEKSRLIGAMISSFVLGFWGSLGIYYTAAQSI